jgi:hypothetical protein
MEDFNADNAAMDAFAAQIAPKDCILQETPMGYKFLGKQVYRKTYNVSISGPNPVTGSGKHNDLIDSSIAINDLINFEFSGILSESYMATVTQTKICGYPNELPIWVIYLDGELRFNYINGELGRSATGYITVYYTKVSD